MSLNASQRQACLETAMVQGGEFEAIYRFLKGRGADRVLALEALFRSLRDIPFNISDPAVAMAKLGWWQQELAQWVFSDDDTGPEDYPQHPVTRSLLSSGVDPTLLQKTLIPYQVKLAECIQGGAPSGMEELKSWLTATAGEEAVLLSGHRPLEPLFSREAASSARLLELIRSLANSSSDHRWLPMDLVARHQYQRGREGQSDSVLAMAQHLAVAALDWRRQTSTQVKNGLNEEMQFLLIRDALVGRRLKKIAKSPNVIMNSTATFTPGDVWTVWKAVRRHPVSAGEAP